MEEPLKNSRSSSVPDTDHWVSFTLRAGVWLSSGLMAVGLILASIFSGSTLNSSHSFTVPNLLAEFFSKRIISTDGAQAPVLLYAGLVVLMITPFFRVLATAIAFGAQRDWRFVGVALIVLTLLVLELVLSLR